MFRWLMAVRDLGILGCGIHGTWFGIIIGQNSGNVFGDDHIVVGAGKSLWRGQMCCLFLQYCFPHASMIYMWEVDECTVTVPVMHEFCL